MAPKYVIEGGAATEHTLKDAFQGNAVFEFIYSAEQEAELARAYDFYPDRMTKDHWVEKKMIFEKTGINETRQIEQVKITLEGVQYTRIIPTEENKERFRTYSNTDLAALTVKLTIENHADAPLNLRSLKSVLAIDGDRAHYFSSGMLETQSKEALAPGESGEKFLVFLFRKDEFNLYKHFDLEFGPFYGEDGRSLFQGQTAAFSLPR